MNVSELTSRQRRVVLGLLIAVVVVFAMLTGFVVTSLQNARAPSSPSTFASGARTPTSLPSEPTPAAETPESTLSAGLGSQVQAARLFDQIRHQVETQRGLERRFEVPLSFLNQREMTTMLHRLYAERQPEAQSAPYAALDVLPSAQITVCAQPSAGVYVPEQRQLYVAADRSTDSAEAQALLAHAYVHALQDQHFDLSAMDDRATTTDAALATQALIEGDAMLSTALYIAGSPAAVDWHPLTELIVQTEKLSCIEGTMLPQMRNEEGLRRDEIWTRIQRFPHWEGREFAEALFQAGDWEIINRAYTAPPRSTEQILHPERYLEQPDQPVEVTVPSLSESLDNDWSLTLEDTLGELGVALYLGETLPEPRAWSAADGWGGDTFVIWEAPDGRRVLVWRSVWDSLKEAREFERALMDLIPQRYAPVRILEPSTGHPGYWWGSNGGAMHVSRAARHVLFVQAPDADRLAAVVDRLP